MAEMEILGAKISDYDMVEILYKAQSDARLLEVINQAELVTPDGSGIVMAAQKLCNRQIERVTGIDLMQELCKQSAACGWQVYLLGAEPCSITPLFAAGMTVISRRTSRPG